MDTLVYIGSRENLQHVESLGFRTHVCSFLEIDDKILQTALTVVIDINTQTHDALQRFIHEITAKYLRVPIILVSTTLDNEYLLWALRSHIWDFVLVPQELPYLNYILHRLSSHRAATKNTAYPRTALRTSPAPHCPAIGLRTHKAKEYITQNYHRKITLDELSSVCNLSPSALSRNFKKENGETVFNFVIRHRLFIASQLLLNSAKSIKEIAFEAGFEDVAYFSKTFRERFGMPPSVYRSEQFIHRNEQNSHNESHSSPP